MTKASAPHNDPLSTAPPARHPATGPDTCALIPAEPAADQQGRASPTPRSGGGTARSTGLVYITTTDINPEIITVLKQDIRRSRLQRNVITSARLIQQDLEATKTRFRACFLTLTYGDTPWKPEHISQTLKLIRQYLKCRGHAFRYVWVLEPQPRSKKPHYHIIIWLPRGVTLPKPDKQGWWKHGFSKIEWARRPVGYIAGYASKAKEFGHFPKGARTHGSGGLTLASRIERAWWMAPLWVREKFTTIDHYPKKILGGWLSRLTGEVIESPWEIVESSMFMTMMKFKRREVTQ